MKIVFYLLALLDVSVGLPSLPNGIKGIKMFVEPLSNYTLKEPVDARIIGGYEVEPNSKPYQAVVLINGFTFCSGSLISPNFVLTSAHCTISASYVEIVLGAHNPKIEEPTQLRVTSTNIIIHEDYTKLGRYSNNDISLVKTPQHVVTNNHIQIIDLAQTDDGSYEGSSAILSGWGTMSDSSVSISSGLRQVLVYILYHSICSNYYGSDVITSSSMCTSGSGTVGACHGDSGSPLVVGKVQVGVTSFFSTRGCGYGDPTGYSRVSYYRKWINQHAGL
ncbi:hypothetical protein NQ315_011574 [Exocentrus adspersus]|uniref:Peptidase S1 domain-containing protein n=1 Tax=Exocentrus adspersus TaxID=1586481 RepID=A0AAV8VVN5_9CUCU|nr:hypothetical protein NQ315_011574 [Exocentrus adspersus]